MKTMKTVKAVKEAHERDLRFYTSLFMFSIFFMFFMSLMLAQPSGPLPVPPPGPAALEQVPILKDAGLDPKLDAALPLDLPFVDEAGRNVTIGQYFGSRPVILVFAYYECPMLCSYVLNGLVESIEALPFTAGREYDVVVVSFDARETAPQAAKKKALYVERYRRAGSASGFHFLTGREESIRQLTQTVGFRYVYDQRINQFAHPALVTIVTPSGHISRYLYGIEFGPTDMRLALVDAAGGKIGTLVDRALLYCYHYDPLTGKYGVAVMRVTRLAGILTVSAIVAFVGIAVRRERRESRNLRTLGPSNPRTLGPSNPRTLGPSNPRTLGPSDPGTS